MLSSNLYNAVATVEDTVKLLGKDFRSSTIILAKTFEASNLGYNSNAIII